MKCGWLYLCHPLAKMDIEKVYNIKENIRMKVIIEAYGKPNLIPLCKNCWEYDEYPQNYCKRELNCVKSVGNHHTKQCSKPIYIYKSGVYTLRKGAP